MPAPLSPWKYSWKSRNWFHCGSLWNFSLAPKTGRRPSPFFRKIAMSLSDRSNATSQSVFIRPVFQKPVQPPRKTGQFEQHRKLERFHGEKRDQANQGVDLHGDHAAIGQVQGVVEESVLFIP